MKKVMEFRGKTKDIIEQLIAISVLKDTEKFKFSQHFDKGYKFAQEASIQGAFEEDLKMLILYLICLKKKDPKNDLFTKHNGITNFDFLGNIKKSLEILNRDNGNEINPIKDKEDYDKLDKSWKNDRSLVINALSFENFPVIKNGNKKDLYQAWSLLKHRILFTNPSYKVDPREYLIKLINSIPKSIFENDFFQLFTHISRFTFPKRYSIFSDTLFSKFLGDILSDEDPKEVCLITDAFAHNDFCSLDLKNSTRIHLGFYEDKSISGSESITNDFANMFPVLKCFAMGKTNFGGYIENPDQKFDKILSDVDITHQLKGPIKKRESLFGSYLSSLFNQTKKNGKVLLILRGHFGKLFPNSIIKKLESCIDFKHFTLFIFKNSTLKTKKASLTGSYFFRDNNDTNYSSLFNNYKNPNKEFTKYLDPKLIIDYSRNLKQAFLPLNQSGIPISKIAKEIKFGFYPELYHQIPILKISDLIGSYGIINENNLYQRIKDRKKEELDVSSLMKKASRLVTLDKPCFIIALEGTSLKSAYFNYTGKKIMISTRKMFAVKLDESKVLPRYLHHELLKDKYSKLLDFLSRSKVLSIYRKEDIMKYLRVELPKIDQQKNEIERISNIQVENLNKQIKEIEKLNDIKIKDDIEFLKHKMGGPIKQLYDLSLKFKYFINQNNIEDLDKKYKEKYNNSISQIPTEITNYTDEISRYLDESYSKVKFSKENYPNKIFSIKELISDIEKRHHKPKNKIKTEVSSSMITEQIDTSKFGVNLNIDSLNILIDQLILNAEKHGFSEQTNKINSIILIEFSIKSNLLNNSREEERLHITIKNNGTPMLKELNKEKFTSPGFTTNKSKGSGVGGKIIEIITNNFEDCKWDLINNIDTEFPVCFEFNFKLDHIN